VAFTSGTGGEEFVSIGRASASLTAAAFAATGVGLGVEAMSMLANRIDENLNSSDISTSAGMFAVSVDESNAHVFDAYVASDELLDSIALETALVFNVGRFAQALLQTEEIQRHDYQEAIGPDLLSRAIAQLCPPPRFPPFC
jgi:hypothetical protein